MWLHLTLGLHGRGVVSLFLSSCEHSYCAPFSTLPKGSEHLFRSVLQSPHYEAGQPASTENQTLKCTETQWGKLFLPFPPSPELCRVTRQLWEEMPARCKQDRGQNGWGYSGESCSQSTLPFHFRYATWQAVFKAAEPVSVFFTKSPSKHVKWVQQEGLKEVLLLLKAEIGTEVP